MADKIELLAEHYQKTYELTYRLWQQRNRAFLLLIVVIAGGAVLTYRPTDVKPLLVAWVAKLLEIKDSRSLGDLENSSLFAFLQTILLVAIFYLMVNLFHRALYVLRNYAYLGAIEKEIRSGLSIPNEAVAFSRESTFYWKDRPWLLSSVKWFYVLILAAVLCIFLVGYTRNKIQTSGWLFSLVDLAIAVITGVYFLGYMIYTLRWDSEDAITDKPPDGHANNASSGPDSGTSSQGVGAKWRFPGLSWRRAAKPENLKPVEPGVQPVSERPGGDTPVH
jgi:hypothetical protein